MATFEIVWRNPEPVKHTLRRHILERGSNHELYVPAGIRRRRMHRLLDNHFRFRSSRRRLRRLERTCLFTSQTEWRPCWVQSNLSCQGQRPSWQEREGDTIGAESEGINAKKEQQIR